VDGIELLLGEAVQVIIAKATVAEQRGEDKWRDGVAEIERTVDAFALLGEPAFHFPQVRSSPDPIGPVLCFPDDGLEFAVQGHFEGSAGDDLLRRRPLPFSYRGSRWDLRAGHASLHLGVILALAGCL